MSAAVFFDVGFDFLGFFNHGGKFRGFRLVKAVIADTQDAIAFRQQRNDVAKVAFPMAAGAGKQQNDRGIFRAEGVNFHRSAPLWQTNHAMLFRLPTSASAYMPPNRVFRLETVS